MVPEKGEFNPSWKPRYLKLLRLPNRDKPELAWFANEELASTFEEVRDQDLALGYLNFSQVEKVLPFEKRSIAELVDKDGRRWKLSFRDAEEGAYEAWLAAFNDAMVGTSDLGSTRKKTTSAAQFRNHAATVFGSLVVDDDLERLFEQHALVVASENPMLKLKESGDENGIELVAQVAIDVTDGVTVTETVDLDGEGMIVSSPSTSRTLNGLLFSDYLRNARRRRTLSIRRTERTEPRFRERRGGVDRRVVVRHRVKQSSSTKRARTSSSRSSSASSAMVAQSQPFLHRPENGCAHRNILAAQEKRRRRSSRSPTGARGSRASSTPR